MSTFAQSLASKACALSVEMCVPGNASVSDILGQARQLAAVTDGIQVVWRPGHPAPLSQTALAALLLREGIDPMAHLHCRGRDREALRSDLAGLGALGVTSLVLNRSDLLQQPGSRTGQSTYEVNCRELISMAVEIGERQMSAHGPGFVVGTSAMVFRPDARWKGELYRARAKAGARFLLTQPCMSVPMLRSFMERLVGLRATWQFAVVATLAPLPGMEFARWQFEDARGTVIPKKLMLEIADADDPERRGVEICAQQMREIAAIPGISGINLLTLGNPAAVVAAIEAAGLRVPNATH